MRNLARCVYGTEATQTPGTSSVSRNRLGRGVLTGNQLHLGKYETAPVKSTLTVAIPDLHQYNQSDAGPTLTLHKSPSPLMAALYTEVCKSATDGADRIMGTARPDMAI